MIFSRVKLPPNLIRYALNGELIESYTKRTFPIREQIVAWTDILSPIAKQLKYEQYFELLEEILSRCNSADRQLAVFHQNQSLHDVVLENVREFESNSPIW